MKAEIIAVGTELLMGYIINSNAADIGQKLLEIGIGTYYQQVVGDNEERILEALDLASKRSDLIILSGGLGPTRDDITKEVVAKYVGTDIVEDQEQFERIKTYLEQADRQMTANQRKQAQSLKGGHTLLNDYGLACGCIYQKDQRYYVVLPGPPYEMNQMLQAQLLPFLQKERKEADVIDSIYLHLFGIGESAVAQQLDDLILKQTNPTIAIYSKLNQVIIRLTANAHSHLKAQNLNQAMADLISQRFEAYYIGQGSKVSLEAYVLDLLEQADRYLLLEDQATNGYLQYHLSQSEHSHRLIAYHDRCRSASVSDPLVLKISQLTAYEENNQTFYRLDLRLTAGQNKLEPKTIVLSQRPWEILMEQVKNHALLFLKEELSSN